MRLYPIESGGAHAQLTYLEKLQYTHEVDLIITPENIAEGDMASFRKQFPKVNLIRAGYTTPNTWQKTASLIRKTFRKLSGRDHSYRLRKFGLLNGLIQTKPGILADIKRISGENEYDIIQTEHSINMGIVELLPPGPVKIFVHHEIAHTRIRSDMQSLGYSEVYADYVSGIAGHIERNWLNLYDGIITLCREDAAQLQSLGVDAPIRVAEPFALFEEELKPVYEAARSPRLLFVGGESHYPNKEGISWFLKEVFPLIIRRKPDCRLMITGAWSKASREQYAAIPGISFSGVLPTLEEVYRDSILIAPVRIGSGVRIKVITALAHGVPVVGTALGLSGIPGMIDGVNALVADTASGFADQVISLLDDPGRRGRLSEQGFLLAKEGNRGGAFSEERSKFYDELLGSRRPNAG